MALSSVKNLLPKTDEAELEPVPATCPKHGDYMANRMESPFSGKVIVFRCPSCQAEERAAREAKEAAEAAQKVEARQRQRLDRAGIPERFRGRCFENYVASTPAARHALDVAKGYAENFKENYDAGRCLIFSGKTGTGKTHLANAIANQILGKGWSPFFVTVRHMVGSVKATWNKRSEKSEIQVIREYIGQDLLIIDEIGVQFDSDAERMIIFDVINGRYEEQLPTIILSNYPIDSTEGPSIRKVLGDRVLDRLRENGGKIVQFNWDSYRGKTA